MIPLLVALTALRLHPMALMEVKWLTLLAPIRSNPGSKFGSYMSILWLGNQSRTHHTNFGRLSLEPGMGASMACIN
jgi:hypothetical protein